MQKLTHIQRSRHIDMGYNSSMVKVMTGYNERSGHDEHDEHDGCDGHMRFSMKRMRSERQICLL